MGVEFNMKKGMVDVTAEPHYHGALAYEAMLGLHK